MVPSHGGANAAQDDDACRRYDGNGAAITAALFGNVVVLTALPRFGTSLEAFWRGRVPLVSTFWDWGILGGLLVHAVAAGVFLWAINENAPFAVKTVIWAAPLPYSAVVLVAVWRSAAAYAGPPWRAAAARWAIAAWTLLTCAI